MLLHPLHDGAELVWTFGEGLNVFLGEVRTIESVLLGIALRCTDCLPDLLCHEARRCGRLAGTCTVLRCPGSALLGNSSFCPRLTRYPVSLTGRLPL